MCWGLHCGKGQNLWVNQPHSPFTLILHLYNFIGFNAVTPFSCQHKWERNQAQYIIPKNTKDILPGQSPLILIEIWLPTSISCRADSTRLRPHHSGDIKGQKQSPGNNSSTMVVQVTFVARLPPNPTAWEHVTRGMTNGRRNHGWSSVCSGYSELQSSPLRNMKGLQYVRTAPGLLKFTLGSTSAPRALYNTEI